MPTDDPNGRTPKQNMPDELRFERLQVECQRCKRKFQNFIFVIIDDLKQLQIGDTLVVDGEFVCMHCGYIFHWHIKNDIRKDISSMTMTYREVITKLEHYRPE